MKQELFLATLVLSMSALAPRGSQQCGNLQDSILRPVKNVASFLEQNPGLDSLSGPGCLYILQQMKLVPSGANLVRALASHRTEGTSSRCLYSVTSIQYSCNQPLLGESLVCAPQAYSYCGQWEYSMTNDSGFEDEMEFAYHLDSTYEKAQALCGMAMRWDTQALESARELRTYLNEQIQESSQKVYGLNCGDSE